MTFVAGRFTLVHVGSEKEELGYVTSWDTWEEAAVAFDPRMPVGFRLIDNETGRVWHPGTQHVWEDAQT